MTAPLVVAVSGMNAGESPQPGPAIARSLREAPGFSCRIVGLLYDAMESGVYSDGLLDDAFLVPYPSSGLDALADRLEEVQARTPIDVLVPSLDAELQAYSRLEPRLRAMGIRMFLPTDDQIQARSKARLPDLTRALSIEMPRQVLASTLEEVARLFASFEPPVIVKGLYYEAGAAHDAWEAERIARKIASKWGWPVILQERVTGEEYDLAMLGDGAGAVLGAVAIKKMALTEKGKAFGGMTISDSRILEIGRAFMKGTRWRGALELEFVKSAKDGRYCLIEVNPRFPAWIYLASRVGQNLPRALVELARGGTVEPFPPAASGVFFVRHAEDLVSDIRRLERLAVGGEIHSEEGHRP